MRFYSIQPSEIDEMTGEEIKLLVECIPILEAREALVGIKIAEYPHLTERGKSKTFKDLKKQANPSILKPEARAISMAELAKLLKD